MSLWFVPAALVAAGVVPVVFAVLRLRREMALLRDEARRLRQLRVAVAEATEAVAATRAKATELSQWRWPGPASVRELAP